MDTLRVEIPGAPAKRYPIHIGSGILGSVRDALVGADRFAVVTDERVHAAWSERWRAELPAAPIEVVLPSGEDYKTLASVERVWTALDEAGFARHDVVINFGGGVIGDLGGFAASTYLRGIDFIQVPTTLLSQVDASVGGKVGVNLLHGKNRIGAFAQPRMVVVDLETLTTLDSRNLRSGCAEILKHGAIADREALDGFDPDLLERPNALAAVVRQSCSIKMAVVAEDEREAGRRQILNFGHTAGHAIESLALGSDDPLLHGEAVAIGMVVAAELSARVAGLDRVAVDHLRTRIGACGLPVTVPDRYDDETLLATLAHDKKKRAGGVEWTLLPELGRATFGHVVSIEDVRSALAAARESA